MFLEWMNAIACMNEHICPWPEKMTLLFPCHGIYENSLEGIYMSKVMMAADSSPQSCAPDPLFYYSMNSQYCHHTGHV